MADGTGEGAQGTLLHAGATHVGLVRAVNEDAWVASAPVFLVADGMGGHSGGDVASRIVAEEFAAWSGRTFSPSGGRQAVVAALVRAQARLRAYTELDAGPKGRHAGTTVVLALLVQGRRGPQWLLANVGDSRAYAVGRDGQVRQVTTDHSVVGELVAAGRLTAAEAAVHPERHVITRALSSTDLAEPDFFDLEVEEAPRLLLCSDGVSGLVPDAELARLLTAGLSPRATVDALVEAALSTGGTDNATAVVVDVVG